ncbi:uncharacterized protein LOC122854757 isoform X1 [Aphidius gifuensis]|nr:uncharacterized protein LOC122854757 isoform X1 [Aphidius gifuensis]XP_044011636.1 uncharacterized protein LOC122854757 isoform X1 [Aphidius gifuensis]
MSNGVEVIVASPTPALRWENSNPQHTIILSESVVMLMPQEDLNEFITKTCTTTFTYLNTMTKNGSTIVFTNQQIVANTATEERHKKLGSESSAVTLDVSPTLHTELFKTTYTYLTLNAEYPDIEDAFGSSEKIITNTVTVPQYYLDVNLEPSELSPPLTNTYISTRNFHKTKVDNGITKVETSFEILTQLIITDSATSTPEPTSVGTTVTALDYKEETSSSAISKSHYVTNIDSKINTDSEISTRIHTIKTTGTQLVTETLHSSEFLNGQTNSQYGGSIKNVVSGSTIIFFDEEDQMDRIGSTSQTATVTSTDLFNPTNEEHNKNDSVKIKFDKKPDPIKNYDSVEKNPSNNNTHKPVGGLLNFGSLGINSLSALGPVITAMAGLLQSTTSVNHKNSSINSTTNSTTVSSDLKQSTIPRSPIYIPVAEFSDGDIDRLDTAESQNILQQIGNSNFTVKTRHKVANNIVNGIPISPGEIITANSDVIIGKPGGLAPRPPKNHENQNYELNSFALASLNIPTNLEINGNSKIGIVKNNDDLLLTPPVRPNIEKYANPNLDPIETQRFTNKHRHSWMKNKPIIAASVVPTPSQIYHHQHHHHDHSYDHEYHDSKRRQNYQDNKQLLWTDNSHVSSVSSFVQLANQSASVKVTKPIIHQVPHVIDRSTGQPLLVNIQPSQTANVVIPQGDVNALIFGGTNEPHISGQYFDEPLPYLQSQKSQPTHPFFNGNSTFYSTVSHLHDGVNLQTNIHQKNRPSNILMLQKPEVYNGSSHGQVHTEILVHRPMDNTGIYVSRPEINQNRPIISSLRQDYHNQKQNEKHMISRKQMSSVSPPTFQFHNNNNNGYLNQQLNKTTTLTNDFLKQKNKKTKNKPPFLVRPLENKAQLPFRKNYDGFVNPGTGDHGYFMQKFSPTRVSYTPNSLSHYSFNNQHKNLQTQSLINNNFGVQYPQNTSSLELSYKQPVFINNIQPNVYQNQPQNYHVPLEVQHVSHDISIPEIQSPVKKIYQPDVKITTSNIDVESSLIFHDSQAEESNENVKKYNQIDKKDDFENSPIESTESMDILLGDNEFSQMENQDIEIHHDDIINVMMTNPVSPTTVEDTNLKYQSTQTEHDNYEFQHSKTIEEKIITEEKLSDENVDVEPLNKNSQDFKIVVDVTDNIDDIRPTHSIQTSSYNSEEIKSQITSSERDYMETSSQEYSPIFDSSKYVHFPSDLVSNYEEHSHIYSNEYENIQQESIMSTLETSKVDKYYTSVIGDYSKLEYGNIDIEKSFTFNKNVDHHSQIVSVINSTPLITSTIIQSSKLKSKKPDNKDYHIDNIKTFNNIKPSIIIYDDNKTPELLYNVNLPKKDDKKLLFTGNFDVYPAVPSRTMMPPSPILKNTMRTKIRSKLEDKNIVGMFPPTVSTSPNSRSSSKPSGKFNRLSNKINRKKPLSPLPQLDMVPPAIQTTKSFAINHLPPQNMVPPPLPSSSPSLLPSPRTVIYSSPMELLTLRPAIAVSGSIQIATDITKSRTSLMQDVESTIPIIHGTVNFSVATDTLKITSSLHTQKTKPIRIHTIKVFEKKHDVSLSSLSSQVFMPTKSKSIEIVSKSSTMQLNIHPVQSYNKELPFSSKVMSPIVILEASYPNTISSTNQINPTALLDDNEMIWDITESSEHHHHNNKAMITKKISNDNFDFEFDNPIELNERKNYTSIIKSTSSDLQLDTTKMTIPTFTNVEIKPTGVTHYKTITITRTETSIIGSPPTTTTIIMTRTITSTVIETVTETLIRPTNIHSTITSVTTLVLPTPTSTTTATTSTIELESSKVSSSDPIDSIFIVMSDQNLPSNNAETIEAEYENEEKIISRDEQEQVNEYHRAMSEDKLSAVLASHGTTITKCYPECQQLKLEICKEVGTSSGIVETRCVCRPGFTRMFPDRPCKPTYTYVLQIALEQNSYQSLLHNTDLNTSITWVSKDLKYLIKDAIDRTLMQSDLRDIYQGIHVLGYHPNLTEVGLRVQFTENTNETRLEEVLKKYLITHNFSLGGTVIHASRNFEKTRVKDFNECLMQEGGPYHDCSPQAYCLNRHGYYECLCKEGWKDITENSLYPGRFCTQTLVGCSSCNNYGHCLSNSYGKKICECFPWHTGQYCQYNLKALLIALVTTGAILLILLIICLVITSFQSAYGKKKYADQRAMIATADDDASSNESITNVTLPHHVPHTLPLPHLSDKRISINTNKHLKKNQNGFKTAKQPCSSTSKIGEDNTDSKGLNVKIPRAKYTTGKQFSNLSVRQLTNIFSSDKRKLFKYVKSEIPEQYKFNQASMTKEYNKDCENSDISRSRNTLNNGALVSAGFQVTATVAKFIDNEPMVDMRIIESSTNKTNRSSIGSKEKTSISSKHWDPSTSQTMSGYFTLDRGGDKNSRTSHMCRDDDIYIHQFSPSSQDTRDARDSASDGPITAERNLGSTLRLQHKISHNTNEISDRDSNFDSL